MAPHSKKCPRGFLCAGDCNEVAEQSQRAVLERVDLLIINKFGKEEARGRGLRAVIAAALLAEIPLLIGVSTQNLRDFLSFVEDSVTRLRPNIEAITAWCRNTIERGAHPRFQPRPSSVQA
jgi:nucleoside-triphosphatase THEP1